MSHSRLRPRQYHDEARRGSVTNERALRLSRAAAWKKQAIAFGQLARLGALDLSTVDSDMSTALAPEQSFVDHRCGARKERILPRPIELSERKRRVGSKPHVASSLTSCASVKKHCGCPENCVNTKDSPGSGSAVSASVLRENVNRNSAHPGRPTRAASRTACRNSAPDRARFQIPCATMKSNTSDANGSWSIDARSKRT